ncbi:hypothetical protein [Mesorhizobium sp. KR9-304]|uniref:hypothetical protein n=1 Tax=Mesorhizobium sp. KR9-304 TaxID=3156614 RepID=UPI0032B4FFFD
MTDWFEGLGGPEFATAVVWTFAALILLVIVLVIIRLIRSLTFGTFVAGGRNRKTRLAVMDATAVDSQRRLVLVRRDDIEHLLLIGGPTDVVVEREIRMSQPRRSQSVFAGAEESPEMPAPVPHPQLPPLPPAPQRQRPPEQLPPLPIRGGAPQPARQPERAPASTQPPERPAQPPPRPTRQTGARPPARETAAPQRPNASRLPPAALPATGSMSATVRQPPLQRPAPRSNNLDDALLRELEVTFEAAPPRTFDTGPPKSPPKPIEMTLDDEMTKLLGELSNNKR